MSGASGERSQARGSASTRCTGVYRSLGDETAGSCSLGRHCTALPLVADHDEYRDAHSRFSEASMPLGPAPAASGGGYADPPPSNQGLLDVITDAMTRLDRINPPRD
jgi:hypothetical protein